MAYPAAIQKILNDKSMPHAVKTKAIVEAIEFQPKETEAWLLAELIMRIYLLEKGT